MLEDFHPLLRGTDEDQVLAVAGDIVRAAGFDHFKFIRFVADPSDPAAGAAYMLSNYPVQWAEKYARERFIAIDPAAIHCLNHWHPLPWTKAMFGSAPVAAIYEEARSFGISAGGSIPLVAGESGFGFARDQDADEALPDTLRAMPRLSLLTGFIMEALNRIGQPWLSRDQPVLSRRELECVKLLAAGMRDGDIADRLNITSRTVMFHLSNARGKLEAANRSQLIARAATAGFL